MKNIKRCYNQALEALLTYEEEEGNVVATWHMLRHESAYRSPADLEAMQKLNQLILYGETEAASALFNHMLDQYRRNIPAFELRREEIFYAMRNILTGLLGQQIFESSSVRLPEYRRDQSFAELISGLKDAAVEMCREVEEKKKGRNEKLKKELLSWLKTNYADPSLTAGQNQPGDRNRGKTSVSTDKRSDWMYTGGISGKHSGESCSGAPPDHSAQ